MLAALMLHESERPQSLIWIFALHACTDQESVVDHIQLPALIPYENDARIDPESVADQLRLHALML